MFDLEDLKHRTNELADFVIAAAQHYGFASDNLVAVGYSNGANIAASMLLLRPEALPTAILFRAMVSETKALDELLRNPGADVTIRYFQAGHELTSQDLEAARDWLTLLR